MIVFTTLVHTNITVNSKLWPSFFPLKSRRNINCQYGSAFNPPASASGADSVRSVEATNTRSVATSYKEPHPGKTYDLSKVERYSVAEWQVGKTSNQCNTQETDGDEENEEDGNRLPLRRGRAARPKVQGAHHF